MTSSACWLVLAISSTLSPMNLEVPVVPVAVWGEVGSEPGRLLHPRGIAVSRDGDVFIADQGNHRVQQFRPDGTFLRAMGSWGGEVVEPPGTGKFANGPWSVMVDREGNVWAGDGGFRIWGFIQRFNAEGAATGGWGLSGGRGCNGFDFVTTIVEGRSGLIYLQDSNRSHLHRSGYGPPNPDDPYFCPFFEYSSTGILRSDGFALAGRDDEIVFIADAERDQIRRYEFGVHQVTFGGRGSEPGQFEGVGPIASDHKNVLYAIDLGNHRVQAFSVGGSFLFEWGRFGTAPGEFDFTRGGGLFVDEAGSVWVVETASHRVQKFATRFTATGATSWGGIKSKYRY